jgi:gamma-glutamyltranspeptidase/glutathione hydrolase
VRELLDPTYVAQRRASIDPEHATPSEEVHPGLPSSVNAALFRQENKETTHFNVLDEQGNAVAVTYTLNNSYGNGIVAPGLGFLLNDDMDDFVAKPGSPNLFGLVGGEANAIAPGKRPLSSMTPTIVTRDGKFFAALGAPGGSTITTGVLEVLLDLIDFHMHAQAAVELPRFHQQWRPDVLSLEPGFRPDVRRTLTNMGYILRPIDGVGRVEVIVNREGVLEGAFDPRQSGKVAAY